MQTPEPSREELVRQIADVIGKAKPLPSRKMQALSLLVSFLIRTACASYSVYMGYLFAIKYALGHESVKSGPITANDQALIYGLAAFFLYMVFRKVYGDRFTPAINMIRLIVFRIAKIVITFLFWNLIFSWFNGLKDSFIAMVATIFIIGSGYDFRLKDRGPKTPSPSSS